MGKLNFKCTWNKEKKVYTLTWKKVKKDMEMVLDEEEVFVASVEVNK